MRDGACVALGGVKRLMGGAMEMMIGTLKGETPKMAKVRIEGVVSCVEFKTNIHRTLTYFRNTLAE